MRINYKKSKKNHHTKYIMSYIVIVMLSFCIHKFSLLIFLIECCFFYLLDIDTKHIKRILSVFLECKKN